MLTVPNFKVKPVGSYTRITLKPSTIKLTGTLVYVPSKQTHDEFGTKYSIGVRFEETEMEQFDKAIEAIAENVAKQVGQEPERKDFHSDGTIFFKLPTNPEQSKFTSQMTPSITPRKLEHSLIQTDEEVSVEFSATGWVQHMADILKVGVNPKVKKVHFGAKPPAKKRKKVEETTDEDELVRHLLMDDL